MSGISCWRALRTSAHKEVDNYMGQPLANPDGRFGLDGIRAVYIWGLLGPIARIDLRSPGGTRYGVPDGLGHTRLLLGSLGSITDRLLHKQEPLFLLRKGKCLL